MPPELPPGWGRDALTGFLDDARGNQFATFAHKRAAKTIIEIDACFMKAEGGWINPRPIMPAQFMFRAHGVFRAAASAALAGQAFEVYPLLRSCLECSAYGLHVAGDDSRFVSWLNQTDDEAAMQKFRKEFVMERLRRTIEQHSKTMLHHFDLLYRQTIDYGGHPNLHGFFSNMKKEDGEDRFTLQSIFLHGDGYQLDLALKTCGQVGMWSLHAFQLVYKERFMLLGIRDRLEHLRKTADL